MNWELLVVQLVLWSPTIISGLCLFFSYRREPRQFRNAIYLLVFVLCISFMLLLRYGQSWMVAPLVIFVLLFPLVSIVALLANGIIAIRKAGFTPVNALPLALAALLVFMIVGLPIFGMTGMPGWIISLAVLVDLEALWFCFTLVSLLLYSTLYRMLPRKRIYSYIVIHGAGLVGTRPSPLLARRCDKAIELWRRQGKVGKFVASGGQGADEVVSEARAMHDYLVEQGVPDTAILMEDRSTTTMENLRYSQEIMDADAQGKSYRCAVVTSDFHVFRCAEYAHQLGIAADGVGSHTAGWYWPAAFIREFVAITKAHLTPYIVIFFLWLVPMLLSLVVS